MSLSATLTELVLACAPLVAPETALRLIQAESANHPFAINVNGPYVLRPQPQTPEQAVATARALLQMPDVASIDVGLAQINSANFRWLGLSLETAFDPCTNLQAMQTVLLDGYARAAARHGPGLKALQEALSRYNTGRPQAGFRNGYVARVWRQPLPSDTPLTPSRPSP